MEVLPVDGLYVPAAQVMQAVKEALPVDGLDRNSLSAVPGRPLRPHAGGVGGHGKARRAAHRVRCAIPSGTEQSAISNQPLPLQPQLPEHGLQRIPRKKHG